MSEKSNAENELKTGSSFSSKTETEQLYDDMTKPAEVEETREQVEQAPEDEEQLEIQREIESYQSKIGELDAKLAAHEAQHIDAMKREEMEEAYYSDEQIERYLSHIQGNTADEIRTSVLALTNEIPPAADNFADPSPFNGRAAKPKTVDAEEIGRQAYRRIKNKIFPWMR